MVFSTETGFVKTRSGSMAQSARLRYCRTRPSSASKSNDAGRGTADDSNCKNGGMEQMNPGHKDQGMKLWRLWTSVCTRDAPFGLHNWEMWAICID